MVNTMIVMILLMINYEFSDDCARVARLILSSVCERGRGERLGGKRGKLEEQRLRSCHHLQLVILVLASSH